MTVEIPGEEVPEIGDDLSDRLEFLEDPDHTDIQTLFPDEEPA